MLNNKKILITGGTGSFGTFFIKFILKEFNPKKIIIFSRDEMKQWNLAIKLNNNKKIEFIIGDVRDKETLIKVTKDIDYIIHAAATKIVPTAEVNPFECIKTNIIGAMNIIDAAKFNKIKKVVALSTDKASSPINLYGATKLASDKLFVAANESKNNSTVFSIVRYGNVMGSRGSVIPFFYDQAKKNKIITITDKKMTRFMISLDDASKLVLEALKTSIGGEIYVKKIPSMNIIDIARSVSETSKLKYIGIRPGEKIHEQMIGKEDAPFTFEYKEYYKILPSIHNFYLDKKRIKDGKKVSNDFSYSSDNNKKWMKISELKKWIKSNLK
tara:strand:+ start:3699 stop:4682 length:984 start_codon:yes stop_codon:yes gene_type:complete